MDALSNAETVEKQCSGLTPIAFPEAKSSETGVSVEYVHDDSGNKQWYVFRASYGRADKAVDYLISRGVYVYVPKQEKDIVVNNRVKTVLADLLPSFVFAYLSDADARSVVNGPSAADDVKDAYKAFRAAGILSFYYNHSKTDGYGKNPPLTIPEHQMKSFIIATNTLDRNLLLLGDRKFTLKSNDEVEVIAGKFKGVKGKVIRVGHQQRILIELTDFITFATAYVPGAFIRKLKD